MAEPRPSTDPAPPTHTIAGQGYVLDAPMGYGAALDAAKARGIDVSAPAPRRPTYRCACLCQCTRRVKGVAGLCRHCRAMAGNPRGMCGSK